jgi:hypothetical protein
MVWTCIFFLLDMTGSDGYVPLKNLMERNKESYLITVQTLESDLITFKP